MKLEVTITIDHVAYLKDLVADLEDRLADDEDDLKLNGWRVQNIEVLPEGEDNA